MIIEEPYPLSEDNILSKDTLDRYTHLKTLSQGSTAQVNLVKDNASGELLVQKSFDRENIARGVHTREAEILKSLSHPNIVQIKHHNNNTEMEEDLQNYLVLEYCNKGELFDFVQAEKFSEDLARHYFQKLIQAVHYLHKEKNIAHRDIKLENILIDHEYQLKLADYGYAIKIDENIDQHNQNNDNHNNNKNNFVGTIKYMSPELFIQEQDFDFEKIDVFACGIVLFSIFMGFPPIMEQASASDALYKFFVNKKQDKYWGYLQKRMNVKINKDFIDLINKMLEPDVESRISLQEIMRHQWFNTENTITFDEITKEMDRRSAQQQQGE